MYPGLQLRSSCVNQILRSSRDGLTSHSTRLPSACGFRQPVNSSLGIKMTTNPIKKLSGLFEKLIIEHGSAVVQEKHIALLKEQFLLLEKENASLKTENNALKNEIVNLKKKISLYEKSSHVITVDEVELKILMYLASQEHDKISPKDISENLGINNQVTTFHLGNLKDKQMVESRQIAPFDHSPKRFWSLSQGGRRYLIENKHIS